jgi:hypothetical protein
MMGSQQVSQHRQRGSVLICVLVVLLLTGLMTMQGARMLLAATRSEMQHARLEQMQELLAVGRMRLQQQLQRTGTSYRGEIFTTEVVEGAVMETFVGEIRIEKVMHDTTKFRWRIVANYPFNQPGQLTASLETE